MPDFDANHSARLLKRGSRLYRFGLNTSPKSFACEHAEENAEHVFITCPRFKCQKTNPVSKVDSPLTVENLARYMMKSDTPSNPVVAAIEPMHQWLEGAITE